MADEVSRGLILQLSANIALLQSNVREAERLFDDLDNKGSQTATRVDQSFKKINQSSGQLRAGMQQLGFQLNDIATGFATGQRPMQIFAQQTSQVIQSIQLMTNSTKGFLGFLNGPWGLAVTAGTVILTPFIAKLFDTGDAADTAKGKVDGLAKAIEELNHLNISPRQAVLQELGDKTVELAVLDAKIARTQGTRAGAQERLRLNQQRAALEAEIAAAKAALELRDVLDRQQERIDKAYPKGERGGGGKTRPAQIKDDAEDAIKSVDALAAELGKLELGRQVKGTPYGSLFQGIDTDSYKARVAQIDATKEAIAKSNSLISDDYYAKMESRVRSLSDFYEQAMTGDTKRIGDLLKEVLIRATAQGLANLRLGGEGGFGGGFVSGLGSLFGGFFADGGDPPVGRPSIVGERGPEIFVPKVPGTILPNRAMSGTTIYQSFDLRGAVVTEQLYQHMQDIATSTVARAAPPIVQVGHQATMRTLTRPRI